MSERRRLECTRQEGDLRTSSRLHPDQRVVARQVDLVDVDDGLVESRPGFSSLAEHARVLDRQHGSPKSVSDRRGEFS